MDYKDLEAGQTNDFFWFKGKNRLIELLVKKATTKKNLKILNIGAGTGDDLEILNKFGKNYIIDVDKKALSAIDKNLYEEKKIGDAEKLPYPDEFFDVVVSFDVFEHVKNDSLALKESQRVLKKNCPLVFTVPAFQFLFSSHDIALKHYRRYSKKILKSRLRKYFHNQKVFFWNSLLFPLISIKRILNKKSTPAVDKAELPKFLNFIFFRLLLFDNFLINFGYSMPFGVSLVGFCFKKG